MKTKYLLFLGCLALPVTFAIADDAKPAGETAAAPASQPETVSGKVTETMNTAGYTYVLVDTGSKKVWAAAVQFAVKVGDSVSFVASDPMVNYHSKSLNRDFDQVFFAGGITVGGNATSSPVQPKLPPGHPSLPETKAATLPPGHPPLLASIAATLPPGHPAIPGEAVAKKVEVTGVKKATGGKTVQEIVANQSKLAGKTVTVRGKVVKYNAMILGKNWLHIQDGSGNADKHDNDLTVTTSTPAKLGDTVLVTGSVSLNKDFGANYKYAVILDDAKVTVE
jgi:hypothetical protein